MSQRDTQTRMDLKRILLSERSQPGRAALCMIPSERHWKRQNSREGTQISGCWEWGAGRRLNSEAQGTVFAMYTAQFFAQIFEGKIRICIIHG